MVWWQEGHLTCKKNPVQLMPTGSVPEQVRKAEAGCDPASPGKKRTLNGSSSIALHVHKCFFATRYSDTNNCR